MTRTGYLVVPAVVDCVDDDVGRPARAEDIAFCPNDVHGDLDLRKQRIQRLGADPYHCSGGVDVAAAVTYGVQPP